MKNESAEDLRNEIESCRRGGRAKYSELLRRRIVAHVQQRKARGESVDAILGELSVGAGSFYIWRSATYKPAVRAKFVEVKVAQEQLRSCGVLHTPQGMRVEGLAVAKIAELLRALG